MNFKTALLSTTLLAASLAGKSQIQYPGAPEQGLPDTLHTSKMGYQFTGFATQHLPNEGNDLVVTMRYKLPGVQNGEVNYEESSRFSTKRKRYETFSQGLWVSKNGPEADTIGYWYNNYGDSRIYGDAENTNGGGLVKHSDQIMAKTDKKVKMYVDAMTDKATTNEFRQAPGYKEATREMFDATLRVLGLKEERDAKITKLMDDLAKHKKMVVSEDGKKGERATKARIRFIPDQDLIMR